jgi:hypothetical protein
MAAFPQAREHVLAGRIMAAFPQAREHVLADGDIASPETCPAEFARAVVDFHADVVLR